VAGEDELGFLLVELWGAGVPLRDAALEGGGAYGTLVGVFAGIGDMVGGELDGAFVEGC